MERWKLPEEAAERLVAELRRRKISIAMISVMVDGIELAVELRIVAPVPYQPSHAAN